MQRECYSFHPHIAIENLSVSLDSGRERFRHLRFWPDTTALFITQPKT